jgi:coenzyme F420-dependent glucose-6-phosphate dehydrogenase
MVQLGYAISSEEHAPNDIVRHAAAAEQAGFPYALISDHYHPWVDAQGHSPFVWSVIGAIAHATSTLKLGTGVTCPIIRIHPAIMAQAAATVACMMPGRFFFGIGTGERLNEHILGDVWPEPTVRLAMLEEAVEVMRTLWEGGYQSHYGDYYTVENARIYDLPPEGKNLPIMIAAKGPAAAQLAGQLGDGFINTSPDAETIEAFDKAGGRGKPKYGQLTVCWARTEEEGKQTAYKVWPNAGLKGPLSTELALPDHFQQAAQMVGEEDIAKQVVCGPDPARHIEKIQEYVDAGYDHVYVHQVGPDQEGMIRFYEREILPHFSATESAAPTSRKAA